MRDHRADLQRWGLIAGLITLVGVGVWLAWPRWRDLVFDENRIVEYLTFAVYVIAFVIGLVAAIRLRGRYRPLSLAVIPAIALLFALEEVDWGFLLFDPEVLGGDRPHLLGKFGVNAHDLPDAFGYAAVHGLLLPLGWVAAIALFALALVGARTAIRWYRRDPLCSEPAIALLVLTLVLAGLAKVVDFHAVKTAVFDLGFDPTPVEESTELAAAVVLFVAALRLRQIVVRDAPLPSAEPAVSRTGSSVSTRTAPEAVKLTVAEPVTTLTSEGP